MKKQWDLSVRGRGHQLVVDGAPSGEDVIRIDGRVAARPLDPDETQRAFFIDGVAYSLRRRGTNDFDLMPIGTGPGHVPTPAADNVGEKRLPKWLRAITQFFRS